jgi:hypothetical protein
MVLWLNENQIIRLEHEKFENKPPHAMIRLILMKYNDETMYYAKVITKLSNTASQHYSTMSNNAGPYRTPC